MGRVAAAGGLCRTRGKRRQMRYGEFDSELAEFLAQGHWKINMMMKINMIRGQVP